MGRRWLRDRVVARFDVDDEARHQSGGRERLIDAIGEVFRVAHSVDQDAQRQTTADNDLLDVEEPRPSLGQHTHQHRRDAGAVGTADSDEDRWCAWLAHLSVGCRRPRGFGSHALDHAGSAARTPGAPTDAGSSVKIVARRRAMRWPIPASCRSPTDRRRSRPRRSGSWEDVPQERQRRQAPAPMLRRSRSCSAL